MRLEKWKNRRNLWKKKVEGKVLEKVNGGSGTELHDLMCAIADVYPDADVRHADDAATFLWNKFGIKMSWDTLDKNIYFHANGNRISHDEVMDLVEKS